MDERAKRERALYERLGVAAFRRFILAIERRKHKKDGRQNENYHPQSLSLSALRSFRGFLSYNILLHSHSLGFCLLALLLLGVYPGRRLWLVLFLCFAALFNLYCLMLQRYTLLKLRTITEKKRRAAQKRAQGAIALVAAALNAKTATRVRDGELLRRLAFCAREGGELRLSAADVPALQSLADTLECALGESAETATAAAQSETPDTEAPSRMLRRVSRLQKRLRRPAGENVLFSCRIAGETPEAEAALRRLIPSADRDERERRLWILTEAYRQTKQTAADAPPT